VTRHRRLPWDAPARYSGQVNATNDQAGLVDSVELVADCPACRTEGALLERYDPDHPACRFGVPATSRCRLCGQRREGRVTRNGAVVPGDGAGAGRCPACHEPLSDEALAGDRCVCGALADLLVVDAGSIPDDERSLGARLVRWADEEGHDDLRTFITGTFAEPDLAAILARLRAGEPVATLADPFALRAAETGGGRVQGTGCRADVTASRAQVSGETTPSPPTSVGAERAVLLPLLAVLAADGEVHPAERVVVNAFLAAEGLAPLTEAECRMHRPEEAASAVPEARREPLLRTMCEVALADGLPDGNEVRVIHAYAAAWGVAHERVEEWLWESEKRHLPRGKALWLKVRRFVLVALWGVPAEEVDEHERQGAQSRLG
jgi:uncharacterized tellurite resistance protein B-like protein